MLDFSDWLQSKLQEGINSDLDYHGNGVLDDEDSIEPKLNQYSKKLGPPVREPSYGGDTQYPYNQTARDKAGKWLRQRTEMNKWAQYLVNYASRNMPEFFDVANQYLKIPHEALQSRDTLFRFLLNSDYYLLDTVYLFLGGDP